MYNTIFENLLGLFFLSTFGDKSEKLLKCLIKCLKRNRELRNFKYLKQILLPIYVELEI